MDKVYQRHFCAVRHVMEKWEKMVGRIRVKIVQYKEPGKWVHYLLLVIPEKYEAHIMNMYHNSLVAMHQGPYKTFLTIRKQFHFPNMLPKLQRYIEACTICQRSKSKRTTQRPYYGRIPVDYIPCENLAVDLKTMPEGFLGYQHLSPHAKRPILYTLYPYKISKLKQ